MGIMPLKYLLDTHTWIWWNMNPKKLSSVVLSLIADEKNYEELLLSAISPWEFSKLLEKKKLSISINPLEWIRIALEMPKLRLVGLTPVISYHSTILEQPFHKDPADQIIVATAQQENAVILTKDERIQKYKYIEALW